MKKVSDLHKEWLKDPEYKKEYEDLAVEFELAEAFIKTRTNAGLTQKELAKKMKTTQSVIARMESGKSLPSAATLKRFAKATGTQLKITFSGNLTQPV